jgi:hypothetical protein
VQQGNALRESLSRSSVRYDDAEEESASAAAAAAADAAAVADMLRASLAEEASARVEMERRLDEETKNRQRAESAAAQLSTQQQQPPPQARVGAGAAGSDPSRRRPAVPPVDAVAAAAGTARKSIMRQSILANAANLRQSASMTTVLAEPAMEGWLSQRAGQGGGKRGWRRRYYALSAESNLLEYYERIRGKDGSGGKKGEIDLAGCLKIRASQAKDKRPHEIGAWA